jgi:hypothetical protein
MITWGDLGNSLWLSAFLVIVSFLLFLPCFGVARLWLGSKVGQRNRPGFIYGSLISGLSLGLTGMIAGFLTGSSRAPAVSALVPAILTFTGLLVIYLIGKSALRAALAAFAVFLFSVNLLVGTVLGSTSRDRHQELLTSVEVRKAKADDEFAVRQYRQGLGLPPEEPKETARSNSDDNEK